MADQASHPRHLTPSELGTKEYWESFYENSLAHLSSKRKSDLGQKNTDHHHHNDINTNTDDDDDGDEDDDEDDYDDDDDPGTSWFTEHNAPEKVLGFLTSEEFPLAPTHTYTDTDAQTRIPSPPSILDIGTGNGSMLKLLRDEGGFGGLMVGIDYSEKSIELARNLAATATTTDSNEDEDGNGNGNGNNIRFEVFDVLNRDEMDGLLVRSGGDWFPHEAGGFDIVLDKGTFDAISLSDEEVGGDKRGGEGRICERYPGAVARLVRRGGYFVITSCNWTEGELVEWFTKTDTTPGRVSGSDGDGNGNGLFVVYDRVEYPKFRFGGQEGQGVCTVCFKRTN